MYCFNSHFALFLIIDSCLCSSLLLNFSRHLENTLYERLWCRKALLIPICSACRSISSFCSSVNFLLPFVIVLGLKMNNVLSMFIFLGALKENSHHFRLEYSTLRYLK